MTYSNITSLLRSTLSLSCAGLLAGLLASACDLPDKNLGNDDDAGGSTTSGGSCEPGDMMMQDCNTCSCVDGEWACTDIACDPTDAACDPLQDPSDDCNECSCVDGEWACTQLDCGTTTGHIDFDCDPDEDQSSECVTCECLASGEWLCTEEDMCTHAVEICEATDPFDPISVIDAKIDGDTLAVSVEHGGGCEPHFYGSCWDGSFAESDPVQVWLQISHEDNDDPCEAVLTAEILVDLVPLRDAWIDAYQESSGTILVHVADWGTLDYTF